MRLIMYFRHRKWQLKVLKSSTINSYAKHPPHQMSTGQTEEEETKLNDSHRAIPFAGGERCCDIEQPCRATFDLE